MLSRRNLRIKVMQSLFALEQCMEANYQLAIDGIEDHFKPDLNSMEVQDKALLNKQKTQAVKLFQKAFKKGDTSVEEHEDLEIKKSVNDAFVLYKKLVKKDTDFFKKNMILEVERIYEHYLQVLTLMAAFVDVAAADKKISHANFLSNAWLQGLHASETLKKEATRLPRQWSQHMEKVRVWFRDVVRQDNEYLAYLDKKKPSQDDQKKFVNHLFRKIILGKTIINDYFEEEVLRWAEDRDIVKGMVEKTIKAFRPEEKTTLSLHTLSVNWEEDREFIEILYSETTKLEKPYKDLIAQNTRNWEVDRLPLTDRIVLEMSIVELLNFPNIPVKVTINEYIELSKLYSTPKSRQFINGILDVIARELKEVGSLKKSGRGLIDNK